MNKAARRILYIFDEVINFIVLAIFVVLTLFCIYIYTDSGRLEAEADTARFVQFKPVEKEHLTFTQLCERNPDVFGWISIDDTGVDYPLVQGRNNSEYVNMTPERTFSLTGSIFLDYRNNRSLTDKVSVIYGHHMEKDRLFGGFDKFEDKTYFVEHETGSIVFDDMIYGIRIFAFLKADGYDTSVYNPRVTEAEFPAWKEHIMSLALQKGEVPGDGARVLLLSTCASMDTNQRLILAAELGEGVPLPDEVPEGVAITWAWPVAVAVAAGCAVVLLVITIRKKHKRR